MRGQHRFVIGQTYENRKGSFKVLLISGSQMRIVFDNGEQVNTSIDDQERILSNIEREQAIESKSNSIRPVRRPTGKIAYPQWYGSIFNGFLELDFNEDVTGTHWRCREQLGGAVTCRIRSEKRYNSWSIYGRPEVHWAEINHRGLEEPHVQSKFLVKVDSESLSYGFYIERSNQENAPRKDWNQFLDWLTKPANSRFLHQLMVDRELQIWDPYFPGYSSSLSLVIRPCPDGFWVQDSSTNTQTIEIVELGETLERTAEEHPESWVNILFGVKFAKNVVLKEQAGIASRIAELFSQLLPLYENFNL